MNSSLLKLVSQACTGTLLLSLTLSVKAGGPAEVAKLTTDTWPEVITNRNEFDKASRAEILTYLASYHDLFAAEVTPAELGVKTINTESLHRWQTQFKKDELKTYLDAAKNCKNAEELGCGFKGNSFDQLLAYSQTFAKTLPANFAPWQTTSQQFYRTYLKEQVRLAALFPNPTSEILSLGKNELIGDLFNDGEFLISMDDGPTQSDDTAHYTQLLRENGISAFFFALGDGLEEKLKKKSPSELKSMYQGQCLASHGYQHKSHQKWEDWKMSLDKTSQLVHQITGNSKPVSFRPPYGQAQISVINYLENQHSTVFLWNIDSQDWQSRMKPNEVSLRVKKLMLLRRKGIILFHDVHKKAFTAIPDAIALSKAANLKWVDCTVW